MFGYQMANFLMCCLYGVFISLVFVYTGFLNMGFVGQAASIIKIIVVPVLVAGYIMSTQIRCIMLNMLPPIVGAQGRGYLGMLLVLCILEGPLVTIRSNWTQLSMSFICYTEIVHNVSMQNIEMLSRPEQAIITEFKENQFQMHDSAAQVKEVFKPVINEVEDEKEVVEIQANLTEASDLGEGNRAQSIEAKYQVEDDELTPEQVEAKYKRKLEYRCEDVFTAAILACKKKLDRAYEDCKKKIKFIGKILCAPAKVSFLCNLMKLFPRLAGTDCNSMNAVDSGFGETYLESKRAAEDYDSNFDVNIDSSVVEGNQTLYDMLISKIESAAQTQNFFLYTWTEREYMRKIVLFLCNLAAMYSAIAFHKGYLSDIRYQNFYVNNYFREIDCSRARAGKQVIRKLKHFEKDEIIEIDGFHMNSREKFKLSINFLIFLLISFMTLMLFVVNAVVYKFVEMNSKYASVEGKQKGRHSIVAHVDGKGIMAKLVRSMMDGFNQTETMNKEWTTADCQPHLEEIKNKSDIMTLLAIILAFIVIEPYFLRLRQVVCDWCYPEKAKLRAKFLYKIVLQRRECINLG